MSGKGADEYGHIERERERERDRERGRRNRVGETE